MPPRSATSMIGRGPQAEKVMSLTGWLKPARAMSCGLAKKSGRMNSRRTSPAKLPSGPRRTDHTELRLSSSLIWFQNCSCPNAGPLQTA